MNSCKHSSGAFWVTVVVAMLLVGYPLSLGPAILLYQQRIPSWARDGIVDFYKPLAEIRGYFPRPVQTAFREYVQRWK